MPAAKQNLQIEQGATWRYGLLLKAGASQTDAQMNLTGYTALMHLRSELEDTTTVVVLSTGNGRIVITPLTGLLELVLTATQTAALRFDSAVYDLEITSSAGEVTRVLQGKVSLSREVTRESGA